MVCPYLVEHFYSSCFKDFVKKFQQLCHLSIGIFWLSFPMWVEVFMFLHIFQIILEYILDFLNLIILRVLKILWRMVIFFVLASNWPDWLRLWVLSRLLWVWHQCHYYFQRLSNAIWICLMCVPVSGLSETWAEVYPVVSSLHELFSV